MNNKNYILAKNILNNSVNLKPDENFLIEVIGISGLELGEEIALQAKKMGSNAVLSFIDYNELEGKLINYSENEIKLWGIEDRERMAKMDAYIAIASKNTGNELSNVPQDKMEMYSKYYTLPVHLEERCKNTKWCLLRYPTEYYAKRSNMTLDEFTNFYYNVCLIDYNKMSNAMDPLVELMNKTDRVHIVGKGTDLTFSIKGIKAEKYFGTFNIPDGEVATSPVKESVNGYISYNTETTYNGIKFENIRFEFAKGKIVNATANKTEELNKILDTDDGARYIGEFALGLNPYVEKPIGDTLFDEKIKGSFHFTPGDSLEESDNGNRSAIHWDIVNIQRSEYGGGEIYFDDVLIRKDGLFVLDSLKNLNPENLI